MNTEETTNKTILINPAMVNAANSWEEFISVWMLSKEADVTNQWLKGDLADKVVGKYGDSGLNKFAGEVGESSATLVEYRRVARAFPENHRVGNLTWSHFQVASYADSYNKGEGKFETDNRFDLIEKADNGNWSTAKLRHEVKAVKTGVETTDFDKYLETVNRLQNYLTHIDRDKLTDSQVAELLRTLKVMVDEVYKHLISS